MNRTSIVFRNAIRICLIVAPIFSSVMSLTSDYNRHPDEIHHFEAAKYYTGHFLPPEIGDPAVRDSYSVWGVSYLNYHWIEYLLAGKFALIVTSLGVDQLVAVRLFNVALFAGLAIFFLYRSRRDEDAWIIPSLLLVTPQVWYVFSYANNDAFPLALSFIAAYLVAYRDSSLNQYLADRERTSIRGGVIAGVLLGLILISKTNYYAFLIFIALWLLFRHQPLTRGGLDTALLRRFATIALVGAAILGFRCSLDFYVNGETNFVGLSYLNYFTGDFEKKESRLLRYQEEIADPQFKPSAIERDLASTFPEMRLKDKGTTYSELFTKWGWHETSFQSFVGVYGYMNIFGGKWYYRLMLILYLSLSAFLIWTAVIGRSREDIAGLAILAVGVAISLFISSYLSWSYALQAQGRYLFPILPMVGCFAYSLRDTIRRDVMAALILAAFAASAWSFFFVGVRKIDLPLNILTAINSPERPADIVISR